MKPDLLHRFVNAMDKGEVAAFRASDHLQNGKWSNQRKQLFKVLLRMGQYNHSMVVKSVSNKEYLAILAIEKHRMYEAAMATVLDLRTRREMKTSPWAFLQQANTLLDMGLVEEATLRTKEGIELAMKIDDLFAELQLREMLRVCFKSVSRAKNLDQIVENEYRLETVVSKVANLTRYALICDNMGDHQKKFRVADDAAVRSAMDALVTEHSMKDMSRAMSLPAQIRFATARAFYAESVGNFREAVDYWKLGLQLWESNPDRIAYRPHFYCQNLSNLIGALSHLGETDQVLALLKKLEEVPITGRRASMLAFCEVELQYQLYYMNTLRLQEALLREKTILNGIQVYGKLMVESKELALLYNLGIVHLVLSNDQRAKECFSRIRDKGILHSRLDIQGLARLFRLLLLLEEDSDDRFHYYLRNYKRTFRKGMPFYSMENRVHQWLIKYHKGFHSSDRKPLLMELHEKLAEFEKQRLIGAEELRLWALSRATGKPIMKLLEGN